MRRPVRLLALLAAVTACLPVAGAAANPYPVTSTADSTDAGTLRWAIEEANARTGPDSIPISATGTIELEGPLPTINDDVTIAGPGASSLTVTRSATAPLFRILEFIGADSTATGLTVSGGFNPAGAGILNALGSLTLIRVVVSGNEAAKAGGGVLFVGGGGILSTGPLVLRESFIHDNSVSASGGADESVASGGGIEATGPVTIERSTISENFVQALAEGGSKAFAEGGGLRLEGGPVTIEESTISGNAVLAAEGSEWNVTRGGGIQAGGITLTGSTVTGNSAATNGAATVEFADGSNLHHSATTLVRNTIVSDPQGDADSCDGLAIVSGGFNLDEGHSCLFGKATDQVDVVPGLDPELKFNGGPTPTHALFENSLAIDRGDSFGSGVDQRGLTRPVDLATKSNTEGGDGADIGAFELQAPPVGEPPAPAPIAVTFAASDRTAPNTRIVSGPARVTFKRHAKFTFNSTEAQSRFECKVDRGRWLVCRSPYKRTVSAGAKHVFNVRAIDRFGNADPTPARFGWRVKKIGG
jgi:hypothetical protein